MLVRLPMKITKKFQNNLNLVSFQLLRISTSLGNSRHQNKCLNFKENIFIINVMPVKTFGSSIKQQIAQN